MRRWGVGYEQLAAVNPRIVLLSLTGFGHTPGPRSHYLAYGSTVCSFVGLTHAWKYSNGVHFDYISEAHGVLGVLAALAARDRTGLGTHVDLAEVETAASVMGPLLLDYIVNGHDSAPRGNQVLGALLSAVVRCRGDDRWLAVEATSGDDWQELAVLTGRRDLGAAELPPDDRVSGELAAALADWARDLTPQQAMRLLQRAGIAAGAVQDAEDLVTDPQHRARNFLIEMDHPDLGVAEYAAPPYRLGKEPPAGRRGPPPRRENPAGG